MKGYIFGGRPVGFVVAAFLVVAAGSAASSAAESAPSGDCLAARVSEPFRLPDGVLYPAGMLTICDTGAYSPVADFHVLLVDGCSVGVFLSRKRPAEAAAGASGEVVFHRDAEGH